MQEDPNIHLARRTLIKWLLEVILVLMQFKEDIQSEFKVWELSIYLIDVYLSKKKIDKNVLQLVGITAFFIAYKVLSGYLV